MGRPRARVNGGKVAANFVFAAIERLTYLVP
jgi:hypothetical protein